MQLKRQRSFKCDWVNNQEHRPFVKLWVVKSWEFHLLLTINVCAYSIPRLAIRPSSASSTHSNVKASLTFKCMTEHLFADFSYSVALDTYLWKQMMQMNRKLIHIWYNVDKKHLLFTKRKYHKFSWLFTTSRCSPRRRSICACQKKIDLRMQNSV